MRIESHQDNAAKMARIAAICLQGDDAHKAWRVEHYRTNVNKDYAWFTGNLHEAMGYRADQPEI